MRRQGFLGGKRLGEMSWWKTTTGCDDSAAGGADEKSFISYQNTKLREFSARIEQGWLEKERKKKMKRKKKREKQNDDAELFTSSLG